MREATFLNQNELKWKKVEKVLEKKSKIDAEETSRLLIEVTDDLSYARTHYPKSVVTKYLNSLSIGVFQRFAQTKKLNFRSVMNFWAKEIPLATGRHLRTMFMVFVFFISCILLGAISTHFDETYPRVVLGDEYVDMTIENIESGDPMGVYKSSSSEAMFIGITTNNIRVATKTFASGIILIVGTLYYLFLNGIMLGTFQYFFVTKGLFWESFLSIWIHGTLEISSIVIAGTAGVIIGKSILFPGSYSRIESLAINSKDAFKIFIGTLPLFVIAGFLESYITRLTGAPSILKLFIILSSLAFLIWYFVLLPILLHKKKTVE